MIMNINESIKVGAVFAENNKPSPRWFVWQKRKYHIQKITYVWRVKNGGTYLLYFAAADNNGNVYEISFNQKSLEWRLESVKE